VDDFAVLIIGLLFFGCEDAELAGESMAIGVEAAMIKVSSDSRGRKSEKQRRLTPRI